MTRFEKYFIYSLWLYSVVLILISIVMWKTTREFRSSVNRIFEEKLAPLRMEVIYKEVK